MTKTTKQGSLNWYAEGCASLDEQIERLSDYDEGRYGIQGIRDRFYASGVKEFGTALDVEIAKIHAARSAGA